MAAMLKTMPPLHLSKAALTDLRKSNFGAPQEPAPAPAWTRRLIDGAPGAPQVPVYVINAQPAGSGKPAILHIHGGGFVLGRAEQSIVPMQRLAQALDCVVVTVDYRLAPETPFPGPVDDLYAALSWLHRAADTLGVDRLRIAIMGESAGGGLTAMLAIRARDRAEYPLLAQVLIYPMLDDRTGTTRSVPEHIGKLLWTRESNRFGWGSFLGIAPGGPKVAYGAVPARVRELRGLPPAFVGVGSIDLFVDEDVEYARRLIAANVATELLVVPGAYHAFEYLAPDSPQASRFSGAIDAYLRRAFAGPGR